MFGLINLLSLALLVPPIWLSIRVMRGFGATRYVPAASDYQPTVSVCIPARNETHAMTECLERVLASDYPKLEILVLDDESKDNTLHLIKAFAHSGVRFIEGDPLPDGWLGKNHALEELSQEASGELILFMDVDTRIRPQTISHLIAQMGSGELEMLSIVPRRDDMWRPSVLFAPLRYYWTITFSSYRFPLAASALWIVNRRVLQDTIGGFSPLKADSEPESSIAKIFSRSGDFKLITSTRELGVSVEKKWSSGVETSVRLLYPAVGARWYKALLAAGGLILLAAPLPIVLTGLLGQWMMIHTVALLAYAAAASVYCVYARNLWSKGWWLGILLWPLVALQELVLLILSCVGYWTHSVTWKGRAVMRTPRRIELPASD